MLGEVEETIYAVDEDDDDEEAKVRFSSTGRQVDSLTIGQLGLENFLLMFTAIRQSAASRRCSLFEVSVARKLISCSANRNTGDSVVLISPQVPF